MLSSILRFVLLEEVIPAVVLFEERDGKDTTGTMRREEFRSACYHTDNSPTTAAIGLIDGLSVETGTATLLIVVDDAGGIGLRKTRYLDIILQSNFCCQV